MINSINNSKGKVDKIQIDHEDHENIIDHHEDHENIIDHE